MTLLSKACDYSVAAHESVNHFYAGNQPYKLHLGMVFDYGTQFATLIPDPDLEIVLAACWTHDLIEDCRKTYNDIQKEFGTTVAEITYALTNEKGKNRKERANDKYYEGIRNCRYATFVKICDRLANVKFSIDTNSSMAAMYLKERGDFKGKLFTEELLPMWDEMDRIFNQYIPK